MYRLPLSSIAIGVRALDANATRYLARVLRLRPGATLEVFDPKTGAHAMAKLIDDAHLEVAPPIAIDATDANAAPVVLVQGVPKGDKLADVIRDATELGATLVLPALTERSVVRLDADKSAARGERLRAVAAEAARQSGRAKAPEIHDPLPFDDALAIARAHASSGYLLYEGGGAPLGKHLLAARATDGVAFVVGPEGGLTEREVHAAETSGFLRASLGRTILRTETVAAAVLGAWLVIGGARDVE